MTVLDAVLVGVPAPLGPKGVPSSIASRRPAAGPVDVGPLGLAGDAVGDPRFHGGLDKAIHHYPRDHYAAWAAELPELAPRLAEAGAFGENLSTRGLTETTLCVGDVFRLGTALLQVTQTRQPCFKLNLRFGVPTVAKRTQQTGRTGWYYRVLEPGQLRAGDRFDLIERPNPDWSLSRLVRHLYVDMLDREALQEISELAGLSEHHRRLARERLERRAVESWDKRLRGDVD